MRELAIVPDVSSEMRNDALINGQGAARLEAVLEAVSDSVSTLDEAVSSDFRRPTTETVGPPLGMLRMPQHVSVRLIWKYSSRTDK